MTARGLASRRCGLMPQQVSVVAKRFMQCYRIEDGKFAETWFRLLAARSQSGATAIEYALIAAGIAIAIITAVQGVGTRLSTNFGKISTSLK
jgi:pilus assembly protein Flp/PilA